MKKPKKPKLYGMRKYWPHLTEEQAQGEREKLSIRQGAKCGVCERPESAFKMKLAVDHNHKTGLVRGLLCFACNKYRVGRLDYEWAMKIVRYLEIEREMPGM